MVALTTFPAAFPQFTQLLTGLRPTDRAFATRRPIGVAAGGVQPSGSVRSRSAPSATCTTGVNRATS